MSSGRVWFDTMFGTPINPLRFGIVGDYDVKLEKYIINENATILFWNDQTKTISKRHQEDKFDKEVGYLFAYFYKKYKGNNSSRKRILETIKEDKTKDFLFEFYVIDTGKTRENARKELQKLVVTK